MQKCTRTQNNNFVKRFLTEKTKRQQKTAAQILKGGKEKATTKHRETIKKEQVYSGRIKGKIKRQGRHSKKENVEKVFLGGNSEEINKKEVSK